MKKVAAFLIILVGLAFCSTSNATITNVTSWADTDGAIVCSNYTWTVGDLDLNIYGDQSGAPAHVFINALTDSAEDPNLTIHNTIDNDTTFAWTAYHVNVFLATNFTLSAATIYPPPNDWTINPIIQPIWNGSAYEGQIDYVGGTPIAINGAFEFGYKMTFSGLTSFTFTQELIPLPEPSSIALVAIGGLLLARFTLGRGRRRG